MFLLKLKQQSTQQEIDKIQAFVASTGFSAYVTYGDLSKHEQIWISVVGFGGDKTKLEEVKKFDCIESHEPIKAGYCLASKQVNPKGRTFKVGGKDGIKEVTFGGDHLVIIGGPCAIESEQLAIDIAQAVKDGGGHVFRGGSFKPRTSPYSFQGLGEDGLKMMKTASQKTGLPFITEVMSERDVELVERYADILQVGARNCQNFALLKELAHVKKPVFIKRGFSTKIDEFLYSAEYLMSKGNLDVMLCERGIRAVENYTRNTLDISAVPVLQSKSQLPVVVDPSHAAGYREFVPALAKAGVAAGANVIMLEVHTEPEKSTSDADQTIDPTTFKNIVSDLGKIANIVGKHL